MKTRFNSFSFILLFTSALELLSGCSNEDDEKNEPEQPVPIACLYNNTITISDINGIPEKITFDKVKAEISGFEWQVIETVDANYKDGSAILVLPSTFSSEKLQPAKRSNEDRTGHWPGNTDNSNALVAQLGDIFAYNNTQKVGRIYLTDYWPKAGSSAGKTFIYYHFADRKFTLSGRNNTYVYEATFEKGWNAYANINPLSEEITGNVSCTTNIPISTNLRWCFESYVY